jgi:saccharopine dehydrogenase (NAD+, L-lysine-forming)
MKTLLIRAEDKNPWERRAPIIPADLKQLIKQSGISALVERSEKRFFKESEYIESGAQICDDMQAGDIIFGVKEIPTQKLLDNKVYLFFSHTIKGQKENMPMLRKIISGGSTLIDYEKIADSSGKRTVYFGNYAGDAGALDILWLMGENWQEKGIETPFTECRQALHYHSVNDAKNHLKKIGQKIKKKGLPDQISPLVVGILGYGNVSKGAQSIIECLPVERIDPWDLNNFDFKKGYSKNKVYLVVFKEEHMVQRKDGSDFNLQEYFEQPDKYESRFEQYLPYLSIIINATYWDKRYPKFVTWKGLEKMILSDPNRKLMGIADITCDVNGSIECNVKTTDTGMPAYRCNPVNQTVEDGHKGDGIVLLAVDNLPAELPNDASTFFSTQLSPYVKDILNADYSKNLDKCGLPDGVKRAVIVYNGQLTESFQYLDKYLKPL